MKDMHSNILAVVGDAAVMAADNTPVAIDRQGFSAVELLLLIGIGGITFTGANKIEFVLSHSDDGTSYTPVADGDVIGVSDISSGIIKTLNSAHAAATAHRFGYKGGKRYLTLLADFSGTHGTGTPIAFTWLLGEPDLAPVDDQA